MREILKSTIAPLGSIILVGLGTAFFVSYISVVMKIQNYSEVFEAKKQYEEKGETQYITQGGANTGYIELSDPYNNHNNTHELFHAFIHRHPNA